MRALFSVYTFKSAVRLCEHKLRTILSSKEFDTMLLSLCVLDLQL